MLMGAMSVAGVGAAQAAAPPMIGAVPTLTGSAEQDSFEAEVLRLTNEARAHSRKCGSKRMKAVRSLNWSPTLASTANGSSTNATNGCCANCPHNH